MNQDEHKIVVRRMAGLIAAASVLIAVYVLRLIFLQLVNSDSFKAQATNTTDYNFTVTAARGDIVDSAGRRIAASTTSYNVVLSKLLMGDEDLDAMLQRIVELLEAHGEKWNDSLLIGEPGFVPCTPKGVMRLLEIEDVPLSGKHAVVVGRSNIVGKPMALLLLQKNCTVTIAHSRTQDLAQVTRGADILVVAVGKAGMITGDMIKPGAVVLDVGINRVEGKVVGDVDFASAAQVASRITPVPGGVGAMTIAMLMENAVEAAEHAAK